MPGGIIADFNITTEVRAGNFFAQFPMPLKSHIKGQPIHPPQQKLKFEEIMNCPRIVGVYLTILWGCHLKG